MTQEEALQAVTNERVCRAVEALAHAEQLAQEAERFKFDTGLFTVRISDDYPQPPITPSVEATARGMTVAIQKAEQQYTGDERRRYTVIAQLPSGGVTVPDEVVKEVTS